jgi:glycosyltransferase involved in cell wall biosynthesis
MDLTVGVPRALLGLEPTSGHGKVWHRVLGLLQEHVRIMPLEQRRLRRRRLDVVLANGHDDLPLVNVPLVVHVHEAGWFTDELRAQIAPDFLAYIETRTGRAARDADQVITLSEASGRDLIAGYGLDPGRVQPVHPGLDPVFLAPGAGGRGLVGRARGGDEAPYVLFAAALHPRKNLAAVREAVALLAAEGYPHVLAIAGRPPADRADSTALLGDAAAELPGTRGRVAMLGQPTDAELASLMAGADAFCLPSLYEGFGLTALEAMGAGAPVVVSDRGALPEVVGDAGIVVDPTGAAVAGALRRVLSDPPLARELAQRGVARAREFTWERTAAGWLDVLLAASGQPYTRPRR